MQDVVAGRREYAVREETEVPFGSRVSWQAGWAGAITALSIATILWALALSIIALTMHPTDTALRGCAIAAWICLIVTIIAGNFFGGLVASWVRGGATRGVGLLHGFLSWALTFVLGVLFGAFLMRGLLIGAVNALPDVMTATPAAPITSDAAAAGRTAIDYLIGFGWTWFGTWFIALLFSLAGALVGLRRARGPVAKVEREEKIPPVTPLTPAPSA
ncbi:MAG TPA: hypothetical protein VF765_16475 [Polyangiaceae bacterium]